MGSTTRCGSTRTNQSPWQGHVTFFTRGWLQVLTDSEIWNWLVWRHRPQVPVREANGAGRPDAGGGNRFFSARSLVGVPRLVRFTPTGDSGLHSLRCRAAARRPHRFREPTLQQHSSGPVGGASTGAGIGAKVRRHGRGRRALGPCAHLDASMSSSPKCSWILVAAAARGRPMWQCARLRWATAVGGGRDPCHRSRRAPLLESLLRSPARRSRQ